MLTVSVDDKSMVTCSAQYLRIVGGTREQLWDFLSEDDEYQKLIGNRIEMPCGNVYVIPEANYIPLVDLPCICGADNHWFVKWEESC